MCVSAACAGEPVPSVADGRTLYVENGCGSCHGPLGQGDGPIAATVDPRPTDLRHRAIFKTAFEEEALADMLATGIARHRHSTGPVAMADAHHNQGMPPFPHLTERERRSLALYVMTLSPPSR